MLQSGERYHGCSVHKVTAELDAGQVLTQAVLNVRHSDTTESLKTRVQKLEHKLLPWTILMIAKDMLPLDHSGSSSEADTYLPSLPLQLFMTS